MGCRTFDTGDFERTGWLDSRVMIDVMIDSLAFKKGSFGWGLELGARPWLALGWELEVRPWFALGTCIVPDGVE